jgi:hypothetical protein
LLLQGAGKEARLVEELENTAVKSLEEPAPDSLDLTGGEPGPAPNGVGPSTRRRAPGADPEVRSFGAARVCAADGCETKLSRYNPDTYCSVHRGWDRQVVTRRRRGGPEG